MKNLKLIAFLILAVAFSSCKKDKLGDDAPKAIVGKWQIKKTVDISYENGTITEEETETNFGAEDYILFNADGTGTLSEEGDTDKFNYKVLADNKLEIIYQGESDSEGPIDIVKLTSNDMVLFIDLSEPFSNTSINYRYTTEITLKK